MRNVVWLKVVPALVAGTMLISGCQAGAVQQKAAPAVVGLAQVQKPALKVPASFADDNAKKDFAIQALTSGHFKEAAPLLKEVVASKPDPVAYKNLGTALYNMKDYKGAIDAWSKAAELDPKLLAEVKNNIGNVLRDTRKIEEAEASYREALKLDVKQWNAGVNLAELLRSQNRLTDAIAVIEQVKANNKDVEPLTSLLESYKAEAKASTKQ